VRDLIQNVGLDADTIKFDIKHVSVCISGLEWNPVAENFATEVL